MQRAKGLKSYSIISSPFGDHNHLLQFTDALVISKHSWEAADSEKQHAMLAFIKYFTSTKFRHDFVMGTDLKIKTPRFLLPPNEDFYTHTDAQKNILYQHLHWALMSAVPAPSLDSNTKRIMQHELSQKCIKITEDTRKKMEF